MNSARQQQLSDELDDRVCTLITTYRNQLGRAPTQQELADELHYRSRTALRNRLYRLRSEGRVSWAHGVPRSLRTMEDV